MTLCDVKGCAWSPEDYHLIPSVLQVGLTSVWPLTSALYLTAAGSSFPGRGSDRPTVHSLPGTTQQTDTVRDQCIVELLAAKELKLSAERRVNSGLKPQVTGTWANVPPSLSSVLWSARGRV